MVQGDTEHLDFDDFHLEPARPAASRRAVTERLVTKRLEQRSPWNSILRWCIVVLICATATQEMAGVYYDRKMTAVAREISGNPDLDVNCRRVWDELLNLKGNDGFVMWGSTTANLGFPICIDAADWANDPTDGDKRIAIMILTHEVAHLSGHFNESETECVAMWTVPQTAVALGATADDGVAVARWYAAEYNPLLRADYQSPGCLNGPAPPSPMLR